jgi:hypothetical protein
MQNHPERETIGLMSKTTATGDFWRPKLGVASGDSDFLRNCGETERDRVRLQSIVQNKVIGLQIGMESVHRVEKEHGGQDAKDSELLFLKSALIGGMDKVGKRLREDVRIEKARSMCLVEVEKGISERGHLDGISHRFMEIEDWAEEILESGGVELFGKRLTTKARPLSTRSAKSANSL